MGRVGYTHCGCGSGDLDESVLHIYLVSALQRGMDIFYDIITDFRKYIKCFGIDFTGKYEKRVPHTPSVNEILLIRMIYSSKEAPKRLPFTVHAIPPARRRGRRE